MAGGGGARKRFVDARVKPGHDEKKVYGRPTMSFMPKLRVSSLKKTSAFLIGAAALAVLGHIALAAQDKYSLQVPNGIAFSDFKGYETWQDIAVSYTDHGVKAILGNAAMIDAYRAGVPGDGKAFPDGSMAVKIEWAPKPNTLSPYTVTVPDTLKSLSFIEKDSKRFADTRGWG
ncbi:MAG TPA: cytochrome P460 family protein, partial [Pirellulales bacterium]|nr:cytochrome P460 family protein [Pirellulales bacterium]